MARPTETVCTIDNFATAGACYSILSLHQQKTLMVYLKALELAALGGTDYTAELGPDGELNNDATAFRTMTDFQVGVAHLVIQADNVTSSGGTVSEDIQVLMEAIECLKDFGDAKLDRMDLLLTCLLGRHAAYPQSDL